LLARGENLISWVWHRQETASRIAAKTVPYIHSGCLWPVHLAKGIENEDVRKAAHFSLQLLGNAKGKKYNFPTKRV
jgi:hypothetical protein